MVDELINESNILINLKASNKDEVLSEMSDLLFKNGFVKDTYKKAVIEREHEFATGLPTNYCSIAIPHTDSEHVIDNGIGIAILANEVPFIEMGSINKVLQVKIVFLLAIDKAEAQLSLLQKLMELFQNDIKLKNILKMNESNKLAELLKSYLSK